VPPLVVASELDQLSDLTGLPHAKQAGDCLVDMCPVYVDFVQCRPRDHAVLRTRLQRPECLVVGNSNMTAHRTACSPSGGAREPSPQKTRSCAGGATSQASIRSSTATLVRVGKRFAEPLVRVPELAVKLRTVAERERGLEKMRGGDCISSR
jgi:hypothetical protein